MKYGAFLRLKSPSEIEEKLYALKEKSFSCCHLVYKPEKYTIEDACVIKNAAEKIGVEISALFAGFRDSYTKWNLYSDFKDAGINSKKYGKKRIEYLKQAATFASNIGTKNMLIHAGFVENNPFSPEYLRMIKLVRELSEYLKSLGLNLLLETGGESPIVLKRLIEDAGTGNIFANLDTANLIMYGFGNPTDAVYTLGSYIKSVHIKDGIPPTDTRNLGKECEFGEGFVDFPRVISLLKENSFDGPYIIEREIADGASEIKISETLEKLRDMVSNTKPFA